MDKVNTKEIADHKEKFLNKVEHIRKIVNHSKKV